MMTGSLNKVSYRSHTALARGETIDPHLEGSDVDVLYKKWNLAWGEPLMFPGGVTAITCEMVKEVPLSALVGAYGKARAARLLEAAQKYAIL